ncbi:MAG: DUF3365 domain-containing protein [Melioribacteraceae bacterium]|jgi:PAS domain S-box-containing protein|nr:DUF3365 domain-containing protein [Melioribacteraceae bacterium]
MKKNLIITGIIWTLGILLFSITDIYHINNSTSTIIRNEALSNFNKDAAARYWSSMHGGVYVPETEVTKPNPFLSHIPERDILTPSGKKLTLMTPSYMLRQTMDNFNKRPGIKGHITSLKYFLPETEPDSWEIKALKAFENGAQEIAEFSTVDGEPFYRLMRPLHVKESCLKCHGNQGYKVGDIRGGVSISIPTKEHTKNSEHEYLFHAIRNTSVWLLGLFMLVFTGKKIITKEYQRNEIKLELEDQKNLLEKTVEKRTRELTEFYEKLKEEIANKEKLKIVLEKSDKIINNSNAVAFIWKNESDWPVEFVSNNVERLLGYSATDFISGNYFYSEIIHKDDLRRIKEELKTFSEDFTTKGFTQKQYRLITKSGQIIWVEDRTSIIRNEKNEIIGYEGFINDISERKRIEAENKFITDFERKIAAISTYFVNLTLKNVNKALSFTSESFGRFLETNRSYVIILNSKNELEINSEFLKGNSKSLKAEFDVLSSKKYSWLHFSLLKGKPLLIENVNQ